MTGELREALDRLRAARYHIVVSLDEIVKELQKALEKEEGEEE